VKNPTRRKRYEEHYPRKHLFHSAASMWRWYVLLARYLVSVYDCCLFRGLSSLLVSRFDVRKTIGLLMRRFYNLREWKELLIACITDVCLWIIRHINPIKSDALAYRFFELSAEYHPPTKKPDEYVFWEQN